jgi:hypothetical protein
MSLLFAFAKKAICLTLAAIMAMPSDLIPTGERISTPSPNYFDIVAGTSPGDNIALGLGAGNSARSFSS